MMGCGDILYIVEALVRLCQADPVWVPTPMAFNSEGYSMVHFVSWHAGKHPFFSATRLKYTANVAIISTKRIKVPADLGILDSPEVLLLGITMIPFKSFFAFFLWLVPVFGMSTHSRSLNFVGILGCFLCWF